MKSYDQGTDVGQPGGDGSSMKGQQELERWWFVSLLRYNWRLILQKLEIKGHQGCPGQKSVNRKIKSRDIWQLCTSFIVIFIRV